jgi:hypothetical protein
MLTVHPRHVLWGSGVQPGRGIVLDVMTAIIANFQQRNLPLSRIFVELVVTVLQPQDSFRAHLVRTTMSQAGQARPAARHALLDTIAYRRRSIMSPICARLVIGALVRRSTACSIRVPRAPSMIRQARTHRMPVLSATLAIIVRAALPVTMLWYVQKGTTVSQVRVLPPRVQQANTKTQKEECHRMTAKYAHLATTARAGHLRLWLAQPAPIPRTQVLVLNHSATPAPPEWRAHRMR